MSAPVPDATRQFMERHFARTGPAQAGPVIHRDVTPATPAQKRELVEDTTRFLRTAADFYTSLRGIAPARFADAGVRQALTQWRQVMSGQGNLVLDDLGGDPRLYQDLRAAYRAAVDALIAGAADASRRPVNDVYETYRALIFEWAMPVRQLAGTSTPLPPSAQVDARTNVATLQQGALRVEVLPDAPQTRQDIQQNGGRAVTDFHFSNTRFSARTRNGRVTSFTGPGTPVVRVQTRWPPGMNQGAQSAYGRGTTREDRAAGQNTVQFHESRHGEDFLRFFRENLYPTFTGAVGMTTAQFRAAMNAYSAAVTTYANRLGADSLRRTDCVGTTIDVINAQQGRQLVCPPP